MAQPTVAHATLVHPIGLTQADLMAETPSTRRADPQPDPASESIIRSKVQAPVVRDSTLARGRLLRWLDEHAQERVRVIAAEAGYGKTTLLADWARRVDRPVRWLKLDPTDSEWTTFISYLVAAFQEGDPDFGQATQRLLAHVATLGTTMDQVTSQFLGEFSAAQMGPCVLIVDDLQHVQGSADVQRILERLIERAPDVLTFILSGRNKPDLRLGRLTAQGNVIGLGTEDLRFTRQETGELFAVGYRMPLDGDLVSVVDTRTEGWGASLQLLYSSICSQRPAEVREFIHGLAGSQEPLYDFLAEEVLERQSPLMQRVLLHAAILDRILPPLVVAALGATDDPPGADAVIDALDAADELGLMSRNAQRSSSRRFHPLLREFLSSHLKVTTPTAVLQLMHLRVAQAAEPIHWPTSAHHYIEADEGQEAMRVIGEATINALGTGAWGAALELVARIPDVEPSVPVQVIRARSLVGRGEAMAALRLLESVSHPESLVGRDRALLRLAIANALNETERAGEVLGLISQIVNDPATPSFLGTVATAWHRMHASPLAPETIEALRLLGVEAEREGLPWYAAVAYHNRAVNLLAKGEYEASIEDARTALRLFGETANDLGHAASTRATMAQAQFEIGDFAGCFEELRKAQAVAEAQPDVFAEAAVLLVWAGMASGAAASIARAQTAVMDRTHPPMTADAVRVADVVFRLAAGETRAAIGLTPAINTTDFDQNQAGLVQFCRAAVAVGGDDRDTAMRVVQSALDEVRRRGATRWVPYLRALRVLANDNSDDVGRLLSGEGPLPDSALLATADLLGRRLLDVDEVPERLGHLARRWPNRWRPALRMALRDNLHSSGLAAARLLSSIGEEQDVELLRQWEKGRRREHRDLRLADSLARRVGPTLRILDLGRAGISVGERRVKIAEVRRRAASLLLFLVSRPRQTATREQVFEALWPDLDADQAANSLHQTLYFLRRELVSEPRSGKPIVEYVPVESELIYLEPDLVQIESVAFVRQASEARNREPWSQSVIPLLHSYQGQFAPEFEYEEWAIRWREQAHTTFLDLAEQAARVRMDEEHAPEAAAILRHALAVDPSAHELKPLMAAALHLSGSLAAARHVYDQIVQEHHQEFGEAPPPFIDILAQAIRKTNRGRPRPE